MLATVCSPQAPIVHFESDGKLKVFVNNSPTGTGDRAASAGHEAEAFLDYFKSVYVHDRSIIPCGAPKFSAKLLKDIVVGTREGSSTLR